MKWSFCWKVVGCLTAEPLRDCYRGREGVYCISVLIWFNANVLESTQSCDNWVVKTVLRLRIAATSIQSTSLIGAGMSSSSIRSHFAGTPPDILLTRWSKRSLRCLLRGTLTNKLVPKPTYKSLWCSVFSFQLWYGGFNRSIMGLPAWLFGLKIKLLRWGALILACCLCASRKV